MSPTNLFAYHVAEHTLFSLLNSISEDTILSATAQILQTLHPTAVCKRFEEENLVCPANLRKGLITVGALDNIDYNPSATTAKRSFQGNGSTIFQLPSHSNGGIVRDPIVIEESPSRKLSLPDEYVNVPAISCKTDQLSIPQLACGDEAACLLEASRADEEKWFQHGIHLLKKDILTKEDYISWAAYHASLDSNPLDPPAVISLLPLFYEKAATLSMVKHGMDVLRSITTHPNPGQIPVMAFDQPLFTLAKFVQWCWPETHGESHFIIMFGGHDIERALWNTLGDLLECSG